MSKCTSASTLLPTGLVLSNEDSPNSTKEIAEMSNVPYREILGVIMWLQVATRPDLSYAVQVLLRFAHNPARQYWNALKHILFYIKETITNGYLLVCD